MPRIFHEMQGPMWLYTPRGEARVVGFFDYGPEDDLYWLVINQDTPHTGTLSIYHNAVVRVMANESMLRGKPDTMPEPVKMPTIASLKEVLGGGKPTEGATS